MSHGQEVKEGGMGRPGDPPGAEGVVDEGDDGHRNAGAGGGRRLTQTGGELKWAMGNIYDVTHAL